MDEPTRPNSGREQHHTSRSIMSPTVLRILSNICFVAGFFSIAASIFVWFNFKEPDASHGERFGIFVGLWAPTFFILSDRFDRYATSLKLPV